MGTMRPNKYDVLTAYGLCQDYLPPDGGDFGCIMYNRRLCNNVPVCTQQSDTSSCRRNSLSDRHFTDSKYNNSRPPGLCEQRLQNSTIRKRNKKILMFQRKLETSWHELQDTCYFNETIVHGYFVFRSVVDLQRRIGFTHRGKPIGPKKNISNDACYMFTKIQADQFFQQHLGKIMASPSTATLTASTTAATKSTLAATTTTTTTTTKTSTAHNKTKESRNKKNNRNKHNNNNHKQHKIQNQLHSNGHNSNISHNHNNNNKREQHTNRNNSNNNTREHVQRHHLVRHHHNDPNSIARRQHHEHKQKRRQQQQHQEQQQQHNRLRATLASLITTTKTLSNSSSTPFTTFTTNTFRKTKQTALSNAKSFTTTTTRTAIINSSIFKKSNQEENVATKATTIRTRTPTVKANKHKGRKRKIERVNKKHAHHKQRLLHKLQQQQQPNVTISTTTTTNFDDDWASSGNWWGNFTDDYNNNSSNNNYNNSDETNNEWLTLEPSISTSLDALSTLDVNDVTEIDESSNYYSSTTSKYRDINNKQQKSTTTLTTTTTLDDSNFSSQSGIDTTSIYAPTYDTSQATETSNATIGDDTWSPTATMYDLDFETNFNNESSENETSANIWATAQSKATVIDTTTSIINHDNSSDIFEYNADNADNSSDHLWTSMHDDTDDHRQLGVTTPLDLPNTPTTSTITKTTTTTIAQNNTKNYKQLQIRPYNKKFYRPGNKNNSKFVRKLANAAVTSANHQHLTTAATTKTRMRKISVPLSKWSITTTTQKSFNHNNNNNHNNKSNIIQINKSISQTSINNNSLIDNFNDHLHASSARASASTVATAKDRPLRISTQRLLATPFHQLIQYVRNDAGEIELDNIDNISVYPDVSEDYSLDSEYDAVQSESNLNKRINLMPNRRLTIKGYLPTSASAVLPESIKIAKIKINKERKRILRQRQRRRHGDGSQA